MDPKNTHKILLYNKPWGVVDEVDNRHIKDGFVLTTNHACFDEASVVICHMPTLSKEDKIFNKHKKRDGQLWVFWSMECESNYRWQYEPEVFGLFDITATYKLASDVPVLYLNNIFFDLFRKEPAPKTGLINAFISSGFNLSNRLGYLQELMSYMDVHSYGKALNNRTLENDRGFDTKGEVISGYKFTIAFENAIGKDYVTEKFFEPLANGSVPVYLGAGNVEEFAPGDHCYINVQSFSSVKALADYLLELDNDDDAYAEFMKWKKLPFREAFEQKKKIMGTDPLIRLCECLTSRMYISL